MRKAGVLVWLYGAWAGALIFTWWLGLALGIGDSGFHFSPLSKPVSNLCNGVSLVATLAGVIWTFVGGRALLLQKPRQGLRLSRLGVWAWFLSALLLEVTTFFYNIERSEYGLVDWAYAIFVIAALAGLLIGPAFPLLKRLKQLS